MKFGKLEVISYAGKDKHKKTLWLCRCECGNETRSIAGHLLAGKSTKCLPCINVTHGHTRNKEKVGVSPTYGTYVAMIARCTDPNHIGWHIYGGNGVSVCGRWLESFENFLADMGERPEDRTLDRINPFGNYEPGNCRWATGKEQAANKREEQIPWNKGLRMPFKPRKKRVNV